MRKSGASRNPLASSPADIQSGDSGAGLELRPGMTTPDAPDQAVPHPHSRPRSGAWSARTSRVLLEPPLPRPARGGRARRRSSTPPSASSSSSASSIAIAGTLAFAELGEHVRKGDTQRFDVAVLQWLGAHHTPLLTAAAVEITYLGTGTVVLTIVGVAALFLWHTEHKHSARLLLAAVAGNILLNGALKLVLPSPAARPCSSGRRIAVSSSFPSGHAMSATVVLRHGGVSARAAAEAPLVARAHAHRARSSSSCSSASRGSTSACTIRPTSLGGHPRRPRVGGLLHGDARGVARPRATSRAARASSKKRRAPTENTRRERARGCDVHAARRPIAHRWNNRCALARRARCRGARRCTPCHRTQESATDGRRRRAPAGASTASPRARASSARCTSAKRGTLKSGKGRHPKVKSREQAIAIGLCEAREKGAKVPRKQQPKKSSTRKKSDRPEEVEQRKKSQ